MDIRLMAMQGFYRLTADGVKQGHILAMCDSQQLAVGGIADAVEPAAGFRFDDVNFLANQVEELQDRLLLPGAGQDRFLAAGRNGQRENVLLGVHLVKQLLGARVP